jgi:2-C-methyl-D-erythritol 2,4-cyclodiphosphate synthase
MAELRVGLGYDLHRTIAGRPLMLGNVQVPHEKGLDGHSDADIVIHALIDALTGAAGLPDVGQLFPNTDPRYKNINSAELLTAANAAFRAAGWRLINADFVILAQRPFLSPYKPAMIKRLAELLGVQESQINLKGKTGERVGTVGKEKAMACQCVVLIERD